jgi:hypothetical protein
LHNEPFDGFDGVGLPDDVAAEGLAWPLGGNGNHQSFYCYDNLLSSDRLGGPKLAQQLGKWPKTGLHIFLTPFELTSFSFELHYHAKRLQFGVRKAWNLPEVIAPAQAHNLEIWES